MRVCSVVAGEVVELPRHAGRAFRIREEPCLEALPDELGAQADADAGDDVGQVPREIHDHALRLSTTWSTRLRPLQPKTPRVIAAARCPIIRGGTARPT